MVDLEIVHRRLRQIDQRVAALRRIQLAESSAVRDDPDVQALVERHLQVAIQAAIDVALHVVAEEGAATPEDYGQAFVSLADLGVIPVSLADRLRGAAGLRNILVHAYLDVDPAKLRVHLDELGDLVDFSDRVESFARRRAEPGRDSRP